MKKHELIVEAVTLANKAEQIKSDRTILPRIKKIGLMMIKTRLFEIKEELQRIEKNE